MWEQNYNPSQLVLYGEVSLNGKSVGRIKLGTVTSTGTGLYRAYVYKSNTCAGLPDAAIDGTLESAKAWVESHVMWL